MEQNLIRAAIKTALDKQIPFYAYKLPNEMELDFGAQLDDSFRAETGFRIFPFLANSSYKERIIYKQFDSEGFIAYAKSDSTVRNAEPACINQKSTPYAAYIDSVKNTLKFINDGNAAKVVISRVITGSKSGYDWCDFFLSLTCKYPDALVFVFSTPETGAWIGATPEILGIYKSRSFSTMALAGTRKAGSHLEWTEKDINEQEYVVRYISGLIESENHEYHISPKFTKKAGYVEHLCNTFSIKDGIDLSQGQSLVMRLHPTPALAGIPKDAAIDCIQRTEQHKREYYGGFIGPFDESEFQYFVNLRCLKFDNEKYEIFVGGGIVKDSVPEKEWEETESKSTTLMSLL